MLIDAFKEMTSHLEGHYTIEEINDIRLYFTNKVTKLKKKAAQKRLKEIPNQYKHLIISVTLPSSKKRKTNGMKNY